MAEHGSSIAENVDSNTFAKLEALKSTLPEAPVHIPSAEAPSFTFESLKEIAIADEAPIEPHTLKERGNGLTDRISTILEEHFGDTLPVLHFTNAKVGHTLDELVSTGFIEKFVEQGTVGKVHVGAYQDSDEQGNIKDIQLNRDSALVVLRKTRTLAKRFYHHGVRTNKNQLGQHRGAAFSVPVVVVFDKPQELIKGLDSPDHWVLPGGHSPDKVVTTVVLHPEKAFTMQMNYKRDVQNEFLKTFIHGMGMYRLEAIKKQFDDARDMKSRQELALYAHDLVDGYLVRREDYDAVFPANFLLSETRGIIQQRREKYKLLTNNKPPENHTS